MQLAIRCCCFLICSLALVLISRGSAKAQSFSYEELQAAYVYNFAKYIKWPEETTTFNIGIIGNDKDALHILTEVLKGKKIGGKPLIVRNIAASETLVSYQMLYFPKESSTELETILKLIENENILIVTEKDLIRKGATISFVVEDNRLRFKLNRDVLQNIGLVASEGLLKLAILY